MKLPISRRRWMQLAGGLVVAGGLGTAWHRNRQRTVRLGLIGAGMRGRQLANSINSTAWYETRGELVAICDADQTRADQLRARCASSAETTQDFRRVLSRDDIDAVFIVTPDHWHAPLALEALRAGKHVYCEKPMTLTIAEGQQLAEAVQKSGRTFLVGTQQRSFQRFQTACELVRNGRLGKLRQIDIAVPENREGGPFQNEPVPASLDWERWLGPAPEVAYCPERFRVFRSWYEYSGGSMTDWGAHHIDIAQWAMGVDHSGPIEISGKATLPQIENGFNTPARFNVELKYASGVTIRVRTSSTENGLLFEGDEGRIQVNRKRLTGKPVDDLTSNPLPVDAVRLGHKRSYWCSYELAHIRHFFDCLLTGDTPISDVISQHRSVSACHLANIALRLGRSIHWDPTTESFVNDEQASTFLRRTARPV